ncbi:MAG: SGNH/GDSL hydrolase family protein, partial [Tissierellaceae bacterium]
WKELTLEDFKYMFKKDKVSHNGYLMRVDTKPVGYLPRERRLPDYQFGDNSYEYLERITKLCKDNDVELILIKSPSVYPYWHEQWDEQIREYAEKNDIQYINFLDYVEEMNIDYERDTYDGGLHLNLIGAEKFTDYFGQILKENYNLPDHRNDESLKKVWEDKIAFYNQMKKEQEEELRLYGYLKSVGEAAQKIDE